MFYIIGINKERSVFTLDKYRIIEVKQSVFEDNNKDADKLRGRLKDEKTLLVNLMSSPGAGKTTTLTKLIALLKDDLKIGVMEADIDSDVDAKTISYTGAKVIQLHTGGMCHLDADMTRQGINELGTKDLDLVILENVGNLVCPAEFDTGAAFNMMILSVPEGHDKPLKYPLVFEVCDAMIINKTDVLPYFDFDMEKVGEYARKRNPNIKIFPISAKTGEGIDNLLETILLTADVKELKANPNRMAKGAIIEAKLDKGKGPMATVLIQNGTLHTGDNLVAGTITGRVRAMIDDKGRNVKEAGPSMAVSILGLEEVPNAGDSIYAVEQDKLSKLVAQERKNKERENMIKQSQKVTLDDLFSKISDGNLKVLNLLIKADVQGSVEAVKQSLTELSDEEVKVNVIHAAVGAINETDVMLADSSNAIIIGFNVRPDANAKALSERSKVEVKLYRIIYEAIDDVKNAMKGLITPKTQEIYMGKAISWQDLYQNKQ